jgi:hypothetical protein
VERFDRGHGMTPLVHVAPAEELAALDAALEQRGWVADGATDILVARSLTRSHGYHFRVAPQLSAGAGPGTAAEARRS